jgi:hypothetical protein
MGCLIFRLVGLLVDKGLTLIIGSRRDALPEFRRRPLVFRVSRAYEMNVARHAELWEQFLELGGISIDV